MIHAAAGLFHSVPPPSVAERPITYLGYHHHALESTVYRKYVVAVASRHSMQNNSRVGV